MSAAIPKSSEVKPGSVPIQSVVVTSPHTATLRVPRGSSRTVPGLPVSVANAASKAVYGTEILARSAGPSAATDWWSESESDVRFGFGFQASGPLAS